MIACALTVPTPGKSESWVASAVLMLQLPETGAAVRKCGRSAAPSVPDVAAPRSLGAALTDGRNAPKDSAATTAAILVRKRFITDLLLVRVQLHFRRTAVSRSFRSRPLAGDSCGCTASRW